MTFQHGTPYSYQRCNGGNSNACDECRRAVAKHNREVYRRRAYGRPHPNDRLDPTLALQVLHAMDQHGLTIAAIAKLTGQTEQHIGRLLKYGAAKFVSRRTHEEILSGWHWLLQHPTWNTPAYLVPSDRSWQQLRSLCALGWRMQDLCEQLGWAGKPPFTKPMMKRETAEQVQALYDRLSGTKGPSSRAAAYARSLGWHVPLAYDDDGRLIPEAIPNDLTRAAERREDRREREQQIAALTAQGLGAAEIAARLGISDRTVTRTRSRRPA